LGADISLKIWDRRFNVGIITSSFVQELEFSFSSFSYFIAYTSYKLERFPPLSGSVWFRRTSGRREENASHIIADYD
jgi:hypothetical protein